MANSRFIRCDKYSQRAILDRCKSRFVKAIRSSGGVIVFEPTDEITSYITGVLKVDNTHHQVTPIPRERENDTTRNKDRA